VETGCAIKILGKQRPLNVVLANRIGSRSRMARGLRKALDEHSRREASAKAEPIILDRLGAVAPGGENVPKIRENFAPPGKNPS
jgi:hypothetical protein